MLISLDKVAPHLGISGIENLTEEETNKITFYIEAASQFIESYCKVKFEVQEHTQQFKSNGQRVIALHKTPLIEVLESDLDYYKTSDIAVYLTERAPYSSFKKIRYTYGYESVPADVEQACLELVLWKYKLHTHIDLTSVVQNQATAQYQVAAIPAFTREILDKYKSKGLLWVLRN